MSIITHVHPFNVTAGSGSTLRTWQGTITWSRDDTTQVVSMRVQGIWTGPSTAGLYIFFNDAPVPAAFRPEIDQYPYIPPVSFDIKPDGTGSAYVSGTGVADATFNYYTPAPTVEPQPDTGSTLEDINEYVRLAGMTIYTGYAPTGAEAPYAVHRPLFIGEENISTAGEIIDWDYQTSIYCCGASVEASFNMARDVMNAIQGKRTGGAVMSTSMGYMGAPVEGHYETQVTVQFNTGGI
jgi:hypothetical protein